MKSLMMCMFVLSGCAAASPASRQGNSYRHTYVEERAFGEAVPQAAVVAPQVSETAPIDFKEVGERDLVRLRLKKVVLILSVLQNEEEWVQKKFFCEETFSYISTKIPQKVSTAIKKNFGKETHPALVASFYMRKYGEAIYCPTDEKNKRKFIALGEKMRKDVGYLPVFNEERYPPGETIGLYRLETKE